MRVTKASQAGEETRLGQGELEQINRLARRELTEGEVYAFSVRLCDNEVDRDGERFEPETLEELAGLFVGKCGIFDHQWSAKGQAARIYRTELVQEFDQLADDIVTAGLYLARDFTVQEQIVYVPTTELVMASKGAEA